jgi:hypothetical protein
LARSPNSEMSSSWGPSAGGSGVTNYESYARW